MQMCKMETKPTNQQLEDATATRIKRLIMKQQQQQPPQETRKKPPPPPPFMKNLALSRWKVTSILLLITLHLGFYLAATTGNVEASDQLQPQQQQQLSSEFVSSQRQQVSFAEPDSQSNVQIVAVGRPVRFKCVVNNLGAHRVAWFHRDRQILLALDNKTLAWPGRIQASTQANSVFVLQIDSVQLTDKPPQIREQETTINIEPVREFSPVELRCAADGIPKPTIKWRRESQTFELPVLDESDTNELDDRHGSDALNDSDRLQRTGDGGGGDKRVRSLPNGSLAKTEVAPLDAESQPAAAASEGTIRTTAGDTANETTEIGAEQSPISSADSSAMPTGEQNEHGDVRSSKESQRASLMMTAPRSRLIARAAAAKQKHRAEGASTPANGSELASNQSATPAPPTKPFIGEGEILRIERVSRYDMGYYECIASNGVPPRVSQRIFLPVSYVAQTRTNNQTSIRAKENNALSQRPSGTQTGNSSSGASSSLEKNGKFRGPLANVTHSEPANTTFLEPNWVASGRSYHRHRQLKATRSSSVSSGAAPLLGAGPPLTLLATMGFVLHCLLLTRPW